MIEQRNRMTFPAQKRTTRSKNWSDPGMGCRSSHIHQAQQDLWSKDIELNTSLTRNSGKTNHIQWQCPPGTAIGKLTGGSSNIPYTPSLWREGHPVLSSSPFHADPAGDFLVHVQQSSLMETEWGPTAWALNAKGNSHISGSRSVWPSLSGTIEPFAVPVSVMKHASGVMVWQKHKQTHSDIR